jgi:hypothetical protein
VKTLAIALVALGSVAFMAVPPPEKKPAREGTGSGAPRAASPEGSVW